MRNIVAQVVVANVFSNGYSQEDKMPINRVETQLEPVQQRSRQDRAAPAVLGALSHPADLSEFCHIRAVADTINHRRLLDGGICGEFTGAYGKPTGTTPWRVSIQG